MNMTKIGSNMGEVNIGKFTILISYKTPVAFYKHGGGFFKTDTYYSVTTSKHINKWLHMSGYVGDRKAVTTVKQEKINSLLGGGTWE